MSVCDRRMSGQRLYGFAVLLAVTASMAVVSAARGETRKFVVVLAHSPKAFIGAGGPGQPPGGLPNISRFQSDYFDRNDQNVKSFVEYWEEISYGDVAVTGDVFGWVTLPWAFEPGPGGRASPVDIINLHRNAAPDCGFSAPVPSPYAYGAGEEWCDCFSSGDINPDINLSKCGATIIIDTVAGRSGVPQPARGEGLSDFEVSGLSVWTPGERFADVDGDRRWDAVDEYNDRMCHGPNGCENACNRFKCSISGESCHEGERLGGRHLCPIFGEACVPAFKRICAFSGEEKTCVTDADCPFGLPCVRIPDASDAPCIPTLEGGEGCASAEEYCGDPPGTGPRGCSYPGCGDLALPGADWNDDDEYENCGGNHYALSGGCTAPELIPCNDETPCPQMGFGRAECLFPFDGDREHGFCQPTNCLPTNRNTDCNIDLPPCCTGDDDVDPDNCVENGRPGLNCLGEQCCDASGNPEGCVDGEPGVSCGNRPILCCEFDDFNRNQQITQTEPFEDFMVRYEPSGASPGSIWFPVDDAYVRNNYPGDVEALVARGGNGYYNPPDVYFERGNSKMVQDAGSLQFAWETPKPGAYYPSWIEQPWFDDFWHDRYGTEPPPWPGGEGPFPGLNSPRMKPFDPDNPTPTGAREGDEDEQSNRQWFQPDRGGFDGEGDFIDNGTVIPFSSGTNQSDAMILPMEDNQFGGFYDGWVEHDDLPSSKYHSQGDKRLGEVTSPGTDTVSLPGGGGEYTAIFGADLGPHDPNQLSPAGDFVGVAGGPYAVNVHGEKGYDAGDVCIVEWMTWRRDGNNLTPGFQWDVDNSPYHPYAGFLSRRCTSAPMRTCFSDSDCQPCFFDPPLCFDLGTCGIPAFGFRDYNLDGMIDQGEVRPELSENYSVDSNPTTPNNGTQSDYPFNRQRMLEDIVAALDPSVDWNDLIDPDSLEQRRCIGGRCPPRFLEPGIEEVVDLTYFGENPDDFVDQQEVDRHVKTLYAEGVVPGVVIFPPGSYGDPGLFPLAPCFYPIHNEDADSFNTAFPDWPDDPGRRCMGTQALCETDTDCGGAVGGCTPRRCSSSGDPCQTNLDCASGQACVWRVCAVSRDACTTNGDCAFNECTSGECRFGGAPCQSNFDCATNFCRDRTYKNFNLHFHDLVTCAGCQGDFPSEVPYVAHEYLHSWERFPDLYDYDIFDGAVDEENCPVGAWDIMANGGLVHPTPILKEFGCTDWARPIDLTTILTPGVETTITFPPAELLRDGYYYLENEQRPGEKYYLWSAGEGFDQRLPAPGVIIMHTDVGANPEGLPLQQRTAPYNYLIVQADGQGELESCSSPGGNRGDEGDVWPGSEGATNFDFHTTPSATWYAQDSWTGLDISNIVLDGQGSARVTMTLTPTNIPSLRFTQPPGGDSVGSIYPVRFEATDVGGGTTIQLFYTSNPNDLSTRPSGPGRNLIAERVKTVPGTVPLAMNWNVVAVPDGRYFIFAKLIPGRGADNLVEKSFTTPRAGRNNRGVGSLSIDQVDVGTSVNSRARAEVWMIELVNEEEDGTQDWVVFGSLSQPEPQEGTVPPDNRPCAQRQDPYPHLCLNPVTQPGGASYTSVDGEVRFKLRQECQTESGSCSTDTPAYQIGDMWSFATTGITATSKPVTVKEGRVTAAPRAVAMATPLSGRPPLTVEFDGRDSTDPNGEPLTFQWTFGDGTAPANGAVVSHDYVRDGDFTAVLKVTNPGGRTDEDAVDIRVINNAPTAQIQASPAAGPAPLNVAFSAAASSDSESGPSQLIYQWDFGDGNGANDQGEVGTRFIDILHRYSTRANGTPCTGANPCTFTATLRVTDTGGKSSSASTQIQVGNSPPTPRITANPLSGAVPLTVTFAAATSTDPDGDPLTVEWKWGDNTPDQPPVPIAQSIQHTYSTVGSYDAVATVKDNKGGSNSAISRITVTQGGGGGPGPDPLVASFTINPDPPRLNQSFTANGSSSTGNVVSYTWSWGDNKPDSTGVTATHTYTQPGTFTIKLTVANANANSNSGTKTVTVVDPNPPEPPQPNRPPTALVTVNPPSAQGAVGQVLTFDARGSSDPDAGDTLTYSWTFGDGASATGATTTHAYRLRGSYVVRLTVRDPDNASTQAALTVNITDVAVNRPPVAIIGTGPRSGSAPTSITFDGRGSYDPDDDPIAFEWEFELNGDIVDTRDGALITQVFDTVGTYEVRLRVTDNDGAESMDGPEMVQIVEQEVPPPPPPPEEPPTQEIPPSQDQRPGTSFCGLGMWFGFFASLAGLSLMKLGRRRLTIS